MKKFIFITVILLGASLVISGCYTYLSLSDGAKLADVPYEPYFPPTPPPPPDPCIDCGYGPPVIIIINPSPDDRKPDYVRPKDISDLRNGGEGRNTDTERRRR